MNLLLPLSHKTPHPHHFLSFSCIYKPKTSTSTSTHNIKTTPNPISISIPARDRVIDFGKHKGKLLGTLPSTYLKWVSKNLRARDFENWAKLADQVLNDPIYRDRIEWEFAEKLLNGTVSSSINAVSELVEMSERFGWDNDDKLGWNRIDFKLLGTSKGGRIPRVSGTGGGVGVGVGVEREVGLKREKVKACDEGSRRERRERVRLKKGVGLELGTTDEVMKLGISGDHEVVSGRDEDQTVENRSPRFPGREALLKKALNRGGRL